MGEVVLQVAGRSVRCAVERNSEEFVVRVGEDALRLRLVTLEPGVLRLTAVGSSRLVHVALGGGRWFLHFDGQTLEYEVGSAEEERSGTTKPARDDLSAPMPGAVTQVLVREGEAVTPGQPLVIIEAMKMEHVVRSPRHGVIRAIRVRPGEQVDGGAVVAEIAPSPSGQGEPR